MPLGPIAWGVRVIFLRSVEGTNSDTQLPNDLVPPKRVATKIRSFANSVADLVAALLGNRAKRSANSCHYWAALLPLTRQQPGNTLPHTWVVLAAERLQQRAFG